MNFTLFTQYLRILYHLYHYTTRKTQSCSFCLFQYLGLSVVGHYKYPAPHVPFTTSHKSSLLLFLPQTKKVTKSKSTTQREPSKMRSFPIPNNTKTTTLAPTTSTIETVTATKTTTSSTSSPLASPWHSPVPYLFGGLAIIMALISMALFILACSYWRLTRSTQQRDMDNINTNKEGDDDPQQKEQPLVYQEKILVIMAGDHKPTFLATPSANTSFLKHLGNSEAFDISQMEISDNKRVVVDDVSDENGSSGGERNQQPS